MKVGNIVKRLEKAAGPKLPSKEKLKALWVGRCKKAGMHPIHYRADADVSVGSGDIIGYNIFITGER